MVTFPTMTNEGDLRAMIVRVYETDLDVSGEWGYDPQSATRLRPMPFPKVQLQFNLAHMRVYLEMNITQPETDRYGGIDLQEIEREQVGDRERVRYRVTGIPEAEYNAFIDEYKEGYGKEDFDLSDHFARRKAATLTREIEYWFDLSEWKED